MLHSQTTVFTLEAHSFDHLLSGLLEIYTHSIPPVATFQELSKTWHWRLLPHEFDVYTFGVYTFLHK